MHFTLDSQVKIRSKLSTLRTIWKFIKAINSAKYHTNLPGNDMYIGSMLNTVHLNFLRPGVVSQFYFPITECAKAHIFGI